MISRTEQRAYELRCEAAALEARERLVSVEISEAAAWAMRDLIGLGGFPRGGITLYEDMRRLNAALGYRPSAPQEELPEPHVSGWSARLVRQVGSR